MRTCARTRQIRLPNAHWIFWIAITAALGMQHSPAHAQTPLSPINVTATYQQAQTRAVIRWNARGTYTVSADLKTNAAATWRGNQVYAQRQGQTPYVWGLQNIGSASWRAFGNELGEINNAGGIWYYRPGLAWKDYTFEFDVRIAGHRGDDDGIGIAWRYTNSSNYYHFYMCGRERYANCRISRFRRRRNGSTTTIQSWPLRNNNNQSINTRYSWVQNTTYRFRVIVRGNNFQVAVRRGGTGNFDTLLNYTESNSNLLLTQGAPATYSFSQSNQRYDNFSLTYADTETNAVKSTLLSGNFNTPWQRLSTRTFAQLLNTQITSWASNYNLTASQVDLTKVYVSIDNQSALFEAKPSTNGTNTTDTNGNSFPYGRAKANQVRSLVHRNGTQLPAMPITVFQHIDNYGPCNVRPGTIYRYQVRIRNPSNQTSALSAAATVTTTNATPTLAALGPFTINRGVAFTRNLNGSMADADSPNSRLRLSENSNFASFSGTTLRVQVPRTYTSATLNVRVTVTDCFGANTSRTIRFNVANRAPAITGNPPTTATAGVKYTDKVNASDPDGDTLTYKLTATGTTAKINPNTGEIEWTPPANNGGKSYTFEVEVCDDQTPPACTKKSWTVTIVNRRPRITSTAPNKGVGGTPYTYAAKAVDPDGDSPLKWSIVTVPPGSGATIDPNTGLLTWNTKPTDGGKTFTFRIRVCDTGTPPLCADQTFTVKLDAPNAPPQIVGTPPTQQQAGQAMAYAPSVSDKDLPNDSHTWKLLKGPAGATIDPKTGAVQWTPSAADAGKDIEFSIEVCDKGGLCATQTWRVRVTAKNSPPSLSGTPPTLADEGKVYSYKPTAKDNDPGDTLTFKLDAGPPGTTIDPKTGQVTWTPPQGSAGKSFTFSITVCDDKGACATQTWTVKVKDGNTKNTPPVIVSTPPTSGVAAKVYTYAAKATDPDANDTQTWTLDKGPAGAKIDANGVVTWTPGAADVGKTADFSIKVCDKAGDCATQSWSVLVGNANRPPQIDGAPSNFASPAKPYNFKPSVSDPDTSDAGKHTWKLKNGPTGATVDPKTGELKWTPSASDVGKVVEFEIEVCDPAGACAQRKWKVRVTNGSTNNDPIIVSTPDTTATEGTPYIYAAKAIDPDTGDTLTWKLKNGPTGASIDPKTGELRWTPGTADVGKTVEIEIEVCDQNNACTTQKFKVTVGKKNGAPIITTQPPKTAYTGEAHVYEPKATDPENDPLTWSLDNAPPGAKIDPNTGKIEWTPGNADADKPATFTVKVCDKGTPPQCSTQTYSVTPRQRCKVDIDCAAPGICVADAANKTVCVPAGCADKSPKCSTNTDFCKDGKCDANPCDSKTCGTGEICRPSDGKCIKTCAGVTCPSGEKCVDGTCEKDPCATAGANGGPCAADEICDTSDSNAAKCVKNPCNDKSCRHGRVCNEGGRCIDDPCVSMTCPTDNRCVAGQCKDLQPCKVDRDCPGDDVCIGDKCRKPGCYTTTPNCPAGGNGVCNEATCKDNQCPQPGGQACAAGEFCRPVANTCVATCAGVKCQGDEKCVDGACVKDDCASVKCNGGSTCVGGKCETDNCNNGNECKHGRVCSGDVNRCIDDPCASIKCPGANQSCVAGQCIQPDCRFDKDCPNDQLCIQRKCVDSDCKQQSDCKSNELCVEGKCTANPCDGKSCSNGQYCKNGNCVDPCAGVFCGDKQLCVDGKCDADPCADVKCQADETCQNGKCVKDLCKGQQNPCKQGRLCKTDACKDDPCQGVTCPNGQTCQAGQCVGDKPCKTDIECAGDGVCIEGKCAPPQCYKDGNCPAGQFCIKAKCTEDPCANKQCGDNETCRPSDGTCVPNCPKCPTGEICQAGSCVADPCKDKTCGAGELCDDSGTCVKDACANGGDQNCRYKRVCQKDSCQDDPCANIKCPAGSTCRAGACYGDGNTGEPSGEPQDEQGQGEPTTDTPGSIDGGNGDTGGTDQSKGDGNTNANEGEIITVGGGCGCQQPTQLPLGGAFFLLLALGLIFRRKQIQ